MNSSSHAGGAVSFRLSWRDDSARVLRGRVLLPARSTQSSAPPCCVLLHGFKGFMDWGFFPRLADDLAQQGIAAVSFNFSGSGIGDDLENFSEDESFAKDTFTRQLEDVERVRQWLERDGPRLDLQRMGLFGHSRGGGMALVHAAERRDYRALATWAAIPSVDLFDTNTIALWREQGFMMIPNARTGRDHRIDLDILHDVEQHRVRLDIQAACGRLGTPTLMVQGTADVVVEPDAVHLLMRAFPPGTAECLLIDGANHTLGARHPLTTVPPTLRQGLDATCAFFKTQLAPEAARSEREQPEREQ